MNDLRQKRYTTRPNHRYCQPTRQPLNATAIALTPHSQSPAWLGTSLI